MCVCVCVCVEEISECAHRCVRALTERNGYRVLKTSAERSPHFACGGRLHLVLVDDPTVELREAQTEALVQLVVTTGGQG